MPAYKNPKRTRQYTNELKAKAVKLIHLSGVSVKGVAEVLDIHPFMLSRWRKESCFVPLVVQQVFSPNFTSEWAKGLPKR